MGIFTMTKGVCDKCGSIVVWDGPYSSCGCYGVKEKIYYPMAEVDKSTIDGIKETGDRIRKKMLDDVS